MALQITPLPPAPQRTDPPAVFVPKADAHVASLAQFVTETNAVATQINGFADSAEVDAALASNSALAASSAANYLGEWSTLTGSQNLGISVSNNGGVWRLTVNVADITASEPALNNSDWVLLSSDGKNIVIADTTVMTAIAPNEIQTTQANPIPLAASVPAETRLIINVPETFKGIETTHLVSGSDTTTDSTGNSDGFIFNWVKGGEVIIISDGISNWRY